MEPEFTNEQLKQIDQIYDALRNLCSVLTKKEKEEFTMSNIGEIADEIADSLAKKGYTVYFPYSDGEEIYNEWK